MRSEKVMYDIILNFANENKNIRAVYINGSRTNKNAPRDIFQDYDIVYVVDCIKPFIENKNWINKFGDIIFMQLPDEFADEKTDIENFYGILMQFSDGNRIDLHLSSIDYAKKNILRDKLCKILLDKDNILPKLSEPTDFDYWVKKPSLSEYLCVCNEFWWCLGNVAKGLWRKEIPYVQDMINFNVRKQLEKMLAWKIGIKTNFSVSVGKSGKYMYKWLNKNEWQTYLETYDAYTIEKCWIAVGKMCALFDRNSIYVGEKLGYEYNLQESKNCHKFLKCVRELPKDANEICDIKL